MNLAKNITATSGDRKPHAVDLHVGRRIRMRRSLIGLSQEKLAEAVGLTFQQIQKYERGQSRVSAGRLYQFANILDVPVSFFYDEYADGRDSRPGAKKTSAPRLALSDNQQDEFISEDKLYSRETLELIRTYYTIQDERKRKELLRIFRSMVESMGN